MLHVFIAVSSLALATFTAISPSRRMLMANYGAIIATILSGVYLVWVEPSRMLHTCEVGLLYLVVVVVMSAAARSRLIHVGSKSSSL